LKLLSETTLSFNWSLIGQTSNFDQWEKGSSSLQSKVFSRVSTGIPSYGLRTEIVRNFFPFLLWKRFRNSGNNFLSVINWKFSEPLSVILKRSRILFQKIPVNGKIVPEFSRKRFRKNVRNILNLLIDKKTRGGGLVYPMSLLKNKN